jgi:hypothetical protein
VELIDELPLGDPNSLGSDLVSQQLFDTQVGLGRWVHSHEQGLAHLPVRTQNLANLADINSNLANLADMNSNLANLADMDSKTWQTLPV